MKFAITLLAAANILMLIVPVRAQVSKNEKEFLHSYFNSNYKEKKIYYSSNVYVGAINHMKESLVEKYSVGSKSKGDSLYALTEVELSFALSAIDSLMAIEWGDSIVDNATLVSDDTLKVLYKNSERERNCLDKFGGQIHSFSHPVFLRGGTICLFYHSTYSDPENGGGDFCVYGRIGNAWFKLEKIYQWVS